MSNQVVLGANAEIYETEHHLHNYEYTFGLHGAYVSGVTCGTRDTLTPYSLTTGINKAWGAWYCLLGTQDTPVKPGYTKYDPHRVVITDASVKNEIFKIQFAYGADAAAVAANLADHHVSEFPFSPLELKTSDKIKDTLVVRANASIPLWVRLQVDDNTARTINFFLLLHEYLR